MIRIGTCLVCGGEDVQIVGGMVEWLEPIDGVIWQHIERCVDRPACRARLELIPGEAWPLRDGTPATVRIEVAEATSSHIEEPDAQAPVVTVDVDAEEVPAWL